MCRRSLFFGVLRSELRTGIQEGNTAAVNIKIATLFSFIFALSPSNGRKGGTMYRCLVCVRVCFIAFFFHVDRSVCEKGSSSGEKLVTERAYLIRPVTIPYNTRKIAPPTKFVFDWIAIPYNTQDSTPH